VLFRSHFSTRPAPSLSTATTRKKVTIQTIQHLHAKNIPISVLTAYDYPSARLLDNAQIDVCLVGDSLAMTALGYSSTNEITLEEMMHHSRAVKRGCSSAFIIGDMPFGTYENNPTQALDNAIRFVKQGCVESVKMEGGREIAEQVLKITTAGIPVMGHVGLTPQKISSLSGYKVQGKTTEKAAKLLQDALALQAAGAFSIVLEAVPTNVAAFITKQLSIPTIGIGAGPHTSGQVLVYLDALGMFDKFMPRFCKVYGHLGDESIKALEQYKKEVVSRVFPDVGEHCYTMESAEEEERFKDWAVEIERKSDV